MAIAMFPLMLASVAFFAHVQASPNRATAAQPVFEIRLAKSLVWENGYLKVSFNLVNRSAKTLFLPSRGVYIESSARLLSSAPEKNAREEWISVFGASDIVRPLQVKPLAPGGMAHYDYSAASTQAVVDLGRELWREVPVRGSLRIEARYYLADPTLLPNRTPEHGDSSVERWLTRRQPSSRVAINRQVTHYAQHIGQIVFLAKHLTVTAGRKWESLSVPRGQSKQFAAEVAAGKRKER